MEQKVCLDTDVVIAILNNEARAATVIKKIRNAIVFISTVTLFELSLRETKLEQIELFRTRVQVLDFHEGASRMASFMFKDLKKKGKLVDIRDLFIASTCIVNRCSLVTFNTRHFKHIKGLKLVL